MGTYTCVAIERNGDIDDAMGARLAEAVNPAIARHADTFDAWWRRPVQWPISVSVPDWQWRAVPLAPGEAAEFAGPFGLRIAVHRGLFAVDFTPKWAEFVDDAQVRAAVLDVARAVAALAGARRLCVLPDSAWDFVEEDALVDFDGFLEALRRGCGPPAHALDDLADEDARYCLVPVIGD
jgi:hypothetical protein